MCVNYEAQLVAAQDKCAELERQVGILERYKDELAKETVLNKQLESKWQESRDQHKNEVNLVYYRFWFVLVITVNC